MQIKTTLLILSDRNGIEQVLRSDSTFNESEITVASELVDETLEKANGDYCFVIGYDNEKIVGYICYGPTPMTNSTYDLYWIAVHKSHRHQGIASKLLQTMETLLIEAKATGIRIETSELENYHAAQKFYGRHNYKEVGRISNFYHNNDALVIYFKHVNL